MINNKEYAKIVGRNLRRIMYDREIHAVLSGGK